MFEHDLLLNIPFHYELHIKSLYLNPILLKGKIVLNIFLSSLIILWYEVFSFLFRFKVLYTNN